MPHLYISHLRTLYHCLKQRFLSPLLISFLYLLAPSASMAKPAQVLVSIKPLHSLISHITEGVNATHLLLTKQQSPHQFQLRPSQKRLINQADIFFYSSDNIESFVPRLKHSTDRLTFVELSALPEVNALSARHTHATHNTHNTQTDTHTGKDIDGHIWLSINNAIHISRHVTALLSQHSPEHSATYQQNLKRLILKLNTLKHENARLLTPYKGISYLVYHDAFQYFEAENQLTEAHFVTLNPEHSPGIKRITTLRTLIENKTIRCIFYEPPTIPSLLNTLAEDKPIQFAPLDPSGSQIPAGKQHYFQLLRKTAATLEQCLRQTR